MAMSKKSRRQIFVRTSCTQRQSLAKLRALLFEKGYAICPLIPAYRRHSHDFAAVFKGYPNSILCVRPGRNGVIELSSDMPVSSHSQLLKVVFSPKSVAQIVWVEESLEGVTINWNELIPERFRPQY